MNILFVCSRNQWRSPTAEKVFRRHPEVRARSAGTSPRARHTITVDDIQWADVVCVMEPKHKNRILASFPRAAREPRIVVLDIPDKYRYMDPELVELIEVALKPIVSREPSRGGLQ
ncbi:MAG: protein tyrosine phosphatase [Pseudomonadota bacterium]